MNNTGTASRPLVVAALAVNVGAVLIALLWHPDQYWQKSLTYLWPALVMLVALPLMVIQVLVKRNGPAALLVRPGVGFVAPSDRRAGYHVAGQLLLAAG